MARNEYKSYAEVERVLKLYGVPKHRIIEMRQALINDALEHRDYVVTERIFLALGLALNELHGFKEEELAPIYQRIYDIGIEVGEDRATWKDRAKELEEKAGIIVCFDEDFPETELPETEA